MEKYILRGVGAGGVWNGPAEEGQWQKVQVGDDRQRLKT
jgi:hypothetical protein